MSQQPARTCPYCGEPLRWIGSRWFGRGTFECERCGEFPDFRAGAGAVALAHRVPPPAPTPARRAPAGPAVGARPRVLMIDDSNGERDLYALMLENCMTILTAARGSEGLEVAAADHPDAIVLDLMMPGMDGWEVCRRLKADPGTASIPVIMLTAQDEPALAARATHHGAATLLTKPCSIEKLTEAITAAIQRPSV